LWKKSVQPGQGLNERRDSPPKEGKNGKKRPLGENLKKPPLGPNLGGAPL